MRYLDFSKVAGEEFINSNIKRIPHIYFTVPATLLLSAHCSNLQNVLFPNWVSKPFLVSGSISKLKSHISLCICLYCAENAILLQKLWLLLDSYHWMELCNGFLRTTIPGARKSRFRLPLPNASLWSLFKMPLYFVPGSEDDMTALTTKSAFKLTAYVQCMMYTVTLEMSKSSCRGSNAPSVTSSAMHEQMRSGWGWSQCFHSFGWVTGMTCGL